MLNSEQFKADSDTQVSFRSPAIITLQGNSGGLTVIGGTATGDDITLKSTSNATKGNIFLDDATILWPSQPTVTATQAVIKYNPTYTNSTAAGTTFDKVFEISPTITLNVNAAAIVSPYHFDVSPIITFNTGLAIVYRVFNYQGTYTSTANAGFASSFTLFNGQPTFSSSVAAVSSPSIGAMYAAGPIYNAGNAAVGATFEKGYTHAPVISCTGGSSSQTITASTGFESIAAYNANTAGSALTITARRGFHYKNFTTTLTGTVVLSANIALDVDATTVSAGNLTNTITVGVRSALTANANTYFLQDTGGAKSEFAGLFTKYNNIATVSNGVPSILATVDLTAQAAALTTAALYTPVTTGAFRVSFMITLTRAATTSSTVGAGVNLNYTTGDGAAAVVQNIPMFIKASTTATVDIGDASNTIGTTLVGDVTVYASTVAMTYDVGYTSVGGTTMQYAVRIKVEAL